ncbi:hypothetical protein Asal01_02731 [Fodinibius salicampi]
MIDGSGKYLIPGLFDSHYHLQDVPNDTVLSSLSLKQLETTGEITTPHLFLLALWVAEENPAPKSALA